MRSSAILCLTLRVEYASYLDVLRFTDRLASDHALTVVIVWMCCAIPLGRASNAGSTAGEVECLLGAASVSKAISLLSAFTKR